MAAARRADRAGARRAARAHHAKAAGKAAPRHAPDPRRRGQRRPVKEPQPDGGELRPVAARAPVEAAERAPDALAASLPPRAARVRVVAVAARAPEEERAPGEAAARRARVASIVPTDALRGVPSHLLVARPSCLTSLSLSRPRGLRAQWTARAMQPGRSGSHRRRRSHRCRVVTGERASNRRALASRRSVLPVSLMVSSPIFAGAYPPVTSKPRLPVPQNVRRGPQLR